MPYRFKVNPLYQTFEFGLFPNLSRALYDVFVTRQLF